MNILLIEDDREASLQLSKALLQAGHNVDTAYDGISGYKLAEEGVYDLYIVDRMLPGKDGLSVIKELRANGKNTPVLILSALGQVEDKVLGLRSGGDDYLSKPYSISELLARVDVLQRRVASENQANLVYTVGSLTLDRVNNIVRSGEDKILLQPREFKLLEYLMRNAGKVVTRSMLLENVWNYHFDPMTNVIDVHISRLRSKINNDSVSLHTVRGVGYMIRDNS